MTYTFRTEDGQHWALDTERGMWSKTSSLLAAPSIIAAEHGLSHLAATETGKLIPIGGGRYAFEGRQPKDGLCLITIMTVLSIEDGGSCVTFLQANVNIMDAAHEDIKKYKCECLPAPVAPQISVRRGK